ncbi:LmbE family N-acetylglucosaminyl deacetylase [Thermosporothrix hazakensis]|uniref:LmbE family N-acetylglucosaminyl deacetylase n=2 Tax=Thermosporothrix TaxID=768650 RepID=A0A326UAL7_THEHA|nr:PIG-L family deacetylase [Thermosporothrix hazakensis]PZW24828.1 LmbE family N-acetylglucosaminyl deacetylase [Thermosporothrix hazakensis]BBH88295.1 GlcNAc-PI de-N-acetylase [Thermosporothrix sp. COM3]GCE46482.1 GlcNAc-PI de-N-acetylase [Thermosporothrix hazakensis]
MRLTSLNDIQRHHRHIFLSPHYDDVVFSCGGTLGVQVSSGLRPLVITVFAGAPDASQPLSPLAQSVQRSMGFGPQTPPQEIQKIRQEEDTKAMELLQCDHLWLDYYDAPYRGNPPLYTEEKVMIGGEVHQADAAIASQLAKDLMALHERLPDAVWYAPLAIGRHVDHQIVCSAADHLAQNGVPVYFYEDFPYVTRPGLLDARLKELSLPLEPTLVEMSEMLELRKEASATYATQINNNFASKEEMLDKIQHYTHSIRPVETIHLERYWTWTYRR